MVIANMDKKKKFAIKLCHSIRTWISKGDLAEEMKQYRFHL
jgi:hypothetical protein